MTRPLKKDKQKKILDWYLNHEKIDHPLSWISTTLFDVLGYAALVLAVAGLVQVAERGVIGSAEAIFISVILGACAHAFVHTQIAVSWWPAMKNFIDFEEVRKKRDELDA